MGCAPSISKVFRIKSVKRNGGRPATAKMAGSHHRRVDVRPVYGGLSSPDPGWRWPSAALVTLEDRERIESASQRGPQ